MRHEMQQHEVPPARVACSSDGAQELLDGPPVQGTRWPLIAKTDRSIQGVESGRDPATLEAVGQECAQIAHAGAQKSS